MESIYISYLKNTYTSFWFCSNKAFISSSTCRTTSSYRSKNSSVLQAVRFSRQNWSKKKLTLYGGKPLSIVRFNSFTSSKALSPNMFYKWVLINYSNVKEIIKYVRKTLSIHFKQPSILNVLRLGCYDLKNRKPNPELFNIFFSKIVWCYKWQSVPYFILIWFHTF